MPLDLSLYLVTDRPLCQGRDLLDVVRAAVRGGATVVQLREKQAGTREFLEVARALRVMLDPLDIPLLVNDRVDVALACGAAGVHLGQSDMPAAAAREILGPKAIIGLSIDDPHQNPRQLEEAAGLPVDYLGIGPVFSTATKADAGPALGLQALRSLLPRIPRPFVGIGGIGLGNAADVVAAGAQGVAVVSAICAAPDPEAAARSLRRAVHEARRGR